MDVSASAAPLIGVDELAAALDGGTPPIVLDARWTLGRDDGHDEFLAGHVPGARFVDVEGGLSGAPGADGRHPLPAFALFADEMRRVGVDDGPVVVTDGGSTLPAARLWWMLIDAGHPDVRVLDGGFAAWAAAKLGIETGPDEPVDRGTWTGTPGRRRSLATVDVEQVSAGTASGQLVDVRAGERYRGETEPIDPVAGHIPGAINAPAAASFVDGRFKPSAELRRQFDDAGVDENAVVYCGSGITACQTLLAMEVAGIAGGTLYPGSWSAWITDPARPIATD